MKNFLLPILIIFCSTAIGKETNKSPTYFLLLPMIGALDTLVSTDVNGLIHLPLIGLPAKGILFKRAYTPNAKCAPSRAIILTGRNSWQLEEAANHQNYFPAKFKSWMEVLRESGYSTGYTGKGWGPGIAKDERGVDRYLTGTAYQREKLVPLGHGISNNDYTANFISFLKESPRGEPWAFWFGTMEPHRSYENGIGRRLGKNI